MDHQYPSDILLNIQDDDESEFEMTTEAEKKKFFYFINDTHYKEMNFSNSIEVSWVTYINVPF